MPKVQQVWIGFIVNNQESLESKIHRFEKTKCRRCLMIDMQNLDGPIEIKNHADNIDEIMFIRTPKHGFGPYWAQRIILEAEELGINVFTRQKITF